MTHKRLFLRDITDEHLLLMQRAAMISPDGKKVDTWLQEIADDFLALFEVPGGIIGLKREPKQIFVELLAGKGMKEHGQEILAAVRELAGGQPIEGFCVSPGALRLYRQLGFQPVGTYVRIDDAQST